VVAPPLLGSAGTLYVAARDGTLSALDANDGTLRWREQTGGPLSAPPAQAADGTLYQGTDNERLLALAPDGTLRWQMQLRGAVRAQPALSEGGRLYVPTTSGRLYAFE
jgi:outer membrane protein assembly factor BamB